MLNWKILGNPFNWLIVWAILFLGALAFHLIAENYKITGTTAAMTA